MKEIDWSNLSFGYMPTDYNVRCNYRDGAWGELEVSSSEYINMHMAATCLHYGKHFVVKTVRYVSSVWRKTQPVCKALAGAL